MLRGLLRKTGSVWEQKNGETSTTNTHIAPASTAEISSLHHFVFLLDFHLAGRSSASLSWALALALTLAPLTHVVEDDAIVLLTTEHSHHIRKLLQVAGEQARGLLRTESTHFVFLTQEGPKTLSTGQRKNISWNLRSQLSGLRIKKKRAEPARKRGRNRRKNEEGHR